MLTKDLLDYRMRAGRVYPCFIKPDCEDALRTADLLIDLYKDAPGMTVGELDEAAGELCPDAPGPAFRKLLSSRVEEEEDDGTIAKMRWRALQVSEKLRRAGASADLSEFQRNVAESLDMDITVLQKRLYGDLPAERRIIEFKELRPEELIHRYNCSQVQGLLMRARRVSISLKGASTADRRALFRALKFHRLMSEVESDPDARALKLELSGPLSLFEQAQTYGIRLANFFPHVLLMPQWCLEADVDGKRKNLKLKLDQGAGLVSHYRRQGGYLPPELLACLEAFNSRSQWQACPGDDFVHIGHQSYCFPDLTIIDQKGGRRVHVELFHRWHHHQLLSRLDALEKSPVQELFIGVSKYLYKSEDIQAAIAKSRWFEIRGFSFGDFPTPKILISLLDRI